MAKQQTLTFIVADNDPDPAEIIESALLEADYAIAFDIVDPAKLFGVGGVIVIIEED